MLLGVRRPRLPFDVMQDFPNDFYDTQWGYYSDEPQTLPGHYLAPREVRQRQEWRAYDPWQEFTSQAFTPRCSDQFARPHYQHRRPRCYHHREGQPADAEVKQVGLGQKKVPAKVNHRWSKSDPSTQELHQSCLNNTELDRAAPNSHSDDVKSHDAIANSMANQSEALHQISEEDSLMKTAPPVQTAESSRVTEAKNKICDVLQALEQLEASVSSFSGTKTEKSFLKLEEELTKQLLRLDEVNASGTPGEEEVRVERKATVKKIQRLLDILEMNATQENVPGNMANATEEHGGSNRLGCSAEDQSADR